MLTGQRKIEDRTLEEDNSKIYRWQEKNFDRQRQRMVHTRTRNLIPHISLGFPYFSRQVKTAPQTHAEIQQGESDSCLGIPAKIIRSL